jgi:hypothetical protein
VDTTDVTNISNNRVITGSNGISEITYITDIMDIKGTAVIKDIMNVS